MNQVRGAESLAANFDAVLHGVEFNVAADGGLDAGEREVEAGRVIVGRECGFAG